MRQQPRDGQVVNSNQRQRDVAARRFHRREVRQQGLRRHRLAADAATLFEVHQFGFWYSPTR
jgi:hypothetical protein